MVWEPFAIAIVFGLIVSAGLYFIVMWPQVEPDEDDDEPVADAPSPPAPVPAPDQPRPAEQAATSPATAPASDVGPAEASPPDAPVTES